MLKRMLAAVAGGAGVMVLVIATMVFIDERLLAPLIWWPLFVFLYVLPETNTINVFNLSRATILATLICDLFVYSLLTHCVLTLRSKLKPDSAAAKARRV